MSVIIFGILVFCVFVVVSVFLTPLVRSDEASVTARARSARRDGTNLSTASSSGTIQSRPFLRGPRR